MRLLDTDTGQFVEKDRDSTHYVVFGDKEEELTLERLRNFQRRYYPLVYQPPQDFSDEGTVSPPLEQDSDGAGSESSPAFSPSQIQLSGATSLRIPPYSPGLQTPEDSPGDTLSLPKSFQLPLNSQPAITPFPILRTRFLMPWLIRFFTPVGFIDRMVDSDDGLLLTSLSQPLVDPSAPHAKEPSRSPPQSIRDVSGFLPLHTIREDRRGSGCEGGTSYSPERIQRRHSPTASHVSSSPTGPLTAFGHVWTESGIEAARPFLEKYGPTPRPASAEASDPSTPSIWDDPELSESRSLELQIMFALMRQRGYHHIRIDL